MDDHIQFGTDRKKEDLRVAILDISGKVLYKRVVKVRAHLGDLPISLNQGLYFIHITSQYNETTVKRVVIAH